MHPPYPGKPENMLIDFSFSNLFSRGSGDKEHSTERAGDAPMPLPSTVEIVAAVTVDYIHTYINLLTAEAFFSTFNPKSGCKPFSGLIHTPPKYHH